jgi:predicted transcriptional regulator
MHRRTAAIFSLPGLLVALALAIPTLAQGQGAQHNETDIAFVNRMTTRLQRAEKRAERLDEAIKQMSRQASQNEMMGQDRYGSQSRTSNQQGNYRRAGTKVRSSRKKAEEEREKLVELQRSGASISPSERERIETTVSRIEREVSDMEHDVRLGRF